MNREFPCPSCNTETPHRFIFTHTSRVFDCGFDVYECEDCGTKRTDPFLTDRQLNDYYTDEAIMGAGRYREWRKKYKYIHDWIAGRITTRAKGVVEIGSNSGNLLRYFKEHSNCDVLGVELSTRCREYSEQTNGVPVFGGLVSRLGAEMERKTDLVIMVHVLEHMSDPITFLRDVFSILDADGHIYVEIPNSRMIEFELLGDDMNPLCIPFHSFIYNMRSACSLLENNGFEVVSRRHWSRKEDGGAITKAYARYLRNRIYDSLGSNLLSACLGWLARRVVRFYPNRYLLGYYYRRKGKSTSIAVLCRKKPPFRGRLQC